LFFLANPMMEFAAFLYLYFYINIKKQVFQHAIK